MTNLVKVLIVLSSLLIPTAAQADPISIAFFLSQAFAVSFATTFAVISFLAANAFTIGVIALNVFGAASARRKARSESAKARAQYNANLIDRLATGLQPNPAWRVVYGRCLTGGDIVAIFTSDKSSVRADGSAYTKPDAYKHLVIHVATHEVEAINDVLIDGVRVGVIDVDGWVVSTSNGTGTGYAISSTAIVGATSIPVASGTGTILAGDEISFTGDSTRYPVVTGVTAAGQTLVIAAPGLLQTASSGTNIQLGNEFAKNQNSALTTVVPGGGSLTVSIPIVAVLAAVYNDLAGDSPTITDIAVTVSGDRLTIFNPSVYPATVSYTAKKVLTSIRIRKNLGSSTQTADATLSAMFPGKWTANHRLQGMAYVVVTLDLEEQRFQGGPPAMTFDVSGRKVYDPRTSLTAYSNNNALVIRDFLTSPWGFECVASDIDDAYTIAAANACDVATVFSSINSLGATVTRTMPLFTCNGAFTTAESPEAILEDLAESMAGNVSYGGQWLIIPGTWTPSAMSLIDTDLDGQISIIQAGAGMDTLFNGAHASYLQFGRTSPSDIVPYQNATFLAADGRELWSNYTFPFTDDEVRARNLCRIFTERNRDGQVIQYPAKLRGWPLRVGERVRVTSAEYGFTAKYYRVTDWQFGMSTAVNLTLQEDSAAAYDQADATTSDPSPNTDLPNPYTVDPIAGLTANSGTAHLFKLGDGTVVPRVRVSWDPITTPYVIPGGTVEVAWQLVGSNDWTAFEVSGSETGAYITNVRDGSVIVIRVVVINSLRAQSSSTFYAHRVVGKTSPPIDVVNFALTQVVAGIQSTWDADTTDLDYGYTEIRSGVVWATGTPIFRGKANSFLWTLPATVAVLPTAWLGLPDTWLNWNTWDQTFGTLPFSLMAKHFDTTNNQSVTAATFALDYLLSQTVGQSVVNFEARNDRISTPVLVPTIAVDGTAIDHTLNVNGSADISFEWAWAGVEAQIDGFEVIVRPSTLAAAYVAGTTPAEETQFFLSAQKRVAFLLGVDPTSHYTFAIRGYRVVDPDISAAGILYSTWAQSTVLLENPYRPSLNAAFAGNITGTIDGMPVTTVNLAVTNFNGRNDRIATAVVNPTIPSDGTAVDHVLNGNGSADVSLEWAWGGVEAEIDGFQIMVHSASVGTAYTVGTAPSSEIIQDVPANKRATILLGVNPTNYLTFAVRAYRTVDTDINAAGVLYSSWVQPGLAAEAPYQPAINYAFAGDVTGTVGGIAAVNVNVWGFISGISIVSSQIGPGEVGTINMAANSTTEAFQQHTTTDSQTYDLSLGLGVRDLCTQTYTNSTAAPVKVEMILTSNRRLTVSSGYLSSLNATTYLNVTVDGIASGPPGSTFTDVAAGTGGGVYKWKESVSWIVTVPATKILIAKSHFEMSAGASAGSATLDSYDVTLRTTVIKK